MATVLADEEAIEAGIRKPRPPAVLVAAARGVAIVAVPFVVFWWRVGLWTLNPLAAARMIVWDYSTYISAPNFLRTAPILTLPIGSTPDHMAPVGSSLGLTDSTPLMTPVYRIANAVWPDRPTQFVGPILLVAYVLTFFVATKIVRLLVRRWHPEPGWYEFLIGLLGATALLLCPMYLFRFVHPTLMHQWIILWPLYTSLRDWPKRRARTKGELGIAVLQIAAAASIQPYFVPIVVAVHVPLFIDVARQSRRLVLGFVGCYVLTTGVIAYVFGYIGSGVESQNEGYGNFAANLAFFVDPSYQSRLLRDIPSLPNSWEGARVSRRRHPSGRPCWRRGTRRGGLVARRDLLAWFRRPLVMGAVLAFFGCLPVLYLADRKIVDLTGPLAPVDSLLHTFRTNGRLVWLLSWSLGFLIVGFVAALRSRITIAVLLIGCVLLQVQDLTPTPVSQRSGADYDLAREVLEAAQAQGASRVQVVPASIMHACTGPEIPIEQIDPVILAAAVQRMPINSGYPGRPVAEFESVICNGETQSFVAGERRADTVYVMSAARPEAADMACTPIAPTLVACRA